MATLMEFKKKEIAKPYQVDNALRAKSANYIVTEGITGTIENNNIKSVYTRLDNAYVIYFFAYKVKFNIAGDFKKYHDMYMDVKIKMNTPYNQAPLMLAGNMFVGINCLNGTFDFSTNTIVWDSADETKSFKPELSNVGRARFFYNHQAIIDAIDPLDYTTKLTDSMIEEIIKNNGEVWVYVMSGDTDVITDRRIGAGSPGGKIHTMKLTSRYGDYVTIEISPIYTYPNYEGSIEENSNIIYKNPSIIRDIKHNLPDIADDSEINRRIVATYPTMMYLYDTAGDMSELNTTIIQNCADENRETAQRLYETTMYDYNPIENYSMTEDGNHTLDGSSNTTTANNATTNYENCEGHKEKGNNRIDSSSEGSNNANGKSDSEATKQQFGYNSKNPTDVEKSLSQADTENNSKTLTRDGSVGSSNNESRTHGKSETKNQANGTENRINNESGMTHLTRKGNIGVTTTQQMIQQEREVILDVLDWYVAKFIKCFKWGAI